MFLVENYIEEDAYPEITADPICGMEIIQEAEDDIHELSMAMIKLEHDAIMHEDASLLVEGEESFGSKVKDVIGRAWEKFKVYLEKVYVAWTSLQAKIMSKFISKEKVSKCQNYINNHSNGKIEIPINLVKIISNFTKIKNKFNSWADGYDNTSESLNSVNNLFQQMDFVDDTVSDKDSQSTTITSQQFDACVKFLVERKTLIEGVKKAQNKAHELYSKGDPKKFTEYQRYCNKFIIAINKVTKASVKLIRKVYTKLEEFKYNENPKQQPQEQPQPSNDVENKDEKTIEAEKRIQDHVEKEKSISVSNDNQSQPEKQSEKPKSKAQLAKEQSREKNIAHHRDPDTGQQLPAYDHKDPNSKAEYNAGQEANRQKNLAKHGLSDADKAAAKQKQEDDVVEAWGTLSRSERVKLQKAQDEGKITENDIDRGLVAILNKDANQYTRADTAAVEKISRIVPSLRPKHMKQNFEAADKLGGENISKLTNAVDKQDGVSKATMKNVQRNLAKDPKELSKGDLQRRKETQEKTGVDLGLKQTKKPKKNRHPKSNLSAGAQKRLNNLIEKEKNNTLTSDETKELASLRKKQGLSESISILDFYM